MNAKATESPGAALAAGTGNEPIYGLDALRFFAALLVTAWHMAFRFFDPEAGHITRYTAGFAPGDPLLPGLSMFGWIGVQMFFVISGVVISYSAMRGTPTRFFISRAARLYPVILISFLLICLIDVLVWNMDPGWVMKEVVKGLLFVPTAVIAPQYWTIPVEVFFYALVWLLMASGKIRRIEALAMGLIAVAAVYWCLLLSGHLPSGSRWVRYFPLRHGMYFGIGIMAFATATSGASRARVLATLAGCALAAMEIRFAVGKYNLTHLFGGHSWLLAYAIWIASLGCIVFSLRAKNRVTAAVERLGIAGILRVAGLATYPVYLIHIHVGGLVASMGLRAGCPAGLAVVLGASVTIAVSVLIVKYLEPPIARGIKWVLTRALQR